MTRSILVVCTANRCRSPMAEALLKEKTAQLRLANEWHVESAGTWAEAGAPATPLAQVVMQKRGLDISRHRSQPIDERLMRTADLILVMTNSHRESLCVEFASEAHKVVLISRLVGGTFNVDDPADGTQQEYEVCANELARIVNTGFDTLIELSGSIQRE